MEGVFSQDGPEDFSTWIFLGRFSSVDGCLSTLFVLSMLNTILAYELDEQILLPFRSLFTVQHRVNCRALGARVPSSITI
jgi:hypothetical protein